MAIGQKQIWLGNWYQILMQAGAGWKSFLSHQTSQQVFHWKDRTGRQWKISLGIFLAAGGFSHYHFMRTAVKCLKPNVYNGLQFQEMGDEHCNVLIILFFQTCKANNLSKCICSIYWGARMKACYRAEAPPKSNYAIIERRCRDICNLMCAKVNMFVRLPLNSAP